MEDTRGFGGSPLQSGAPTGGRAVAGAGAGLANDTGEYNCFLNAIIQVWGHLQQAPLYAFSKHTYSSCMIRVRASCRLVKYFCSEA
jgi:hypothetical protein